MSSAVRFPGDVLSLTELSAAVLDGDVVPLGEGFVPTDAVETPWLRAQSLVPMLAPSLTATHLLAAWVWGALADCPAVLTVQRAVKQRVTVYPRARVVYRDGFVGDADVEWFGTVAVTTIGRTVADLARARDLSAIQLLAFNDDDAIASGLAWCRQHTRYAGVPAAMALLERLAADAPPMTG